MTSSGRRYRGTHREVYIPDTAAGKGAVELLKRAFSEGTAL